MSQMCPNCSFDNPTDAHDCSNCSAPLRGLLGSLVTLSERYQVVSVLGFGAMGAVYLAEDQRLVGRRCAIKENSPDPKASVDVRAQSRDQFLAEASILARLDHPSLPKVSDYFIENDREYLVMDYVEGEDLQSRLERVEQPLPEEPVLNWADQVLDALKYLHNQSPQPIIHRDIKPANLRVNLQDRVKLVDFGLVKLLDLDNPETKVELRGMGTPAYAPLEQFAGSDVHTDTRSDIYSLGASLYQLLTNVAPVDVHQRLLDTQVLAPPHELNPDISENTEQVILKAMEIYPEQRFQSADEMRQALLSGIETVAPPPTKTERAQDAPVPTSFWVLGFLGLLLVLLVLGGIFLVLFRDGSASQEVAQAPAGTGQALPAETATSIELRALNDAPTDTPTPTSVAMNETEVTATQETSPTPSATTTSASTPTPETTPTGSTISSTGRRIPATSLSGTIAVPVYNGTDFDLYFGQADGSGIELYREHASQPAFSSDGTRIAFHSWFDKWGLIHTDLSGGDEILVADFVEDQLPTWTKDGSLIIYLSRREGDRKSRLMKVGSTELNSDGAVIGEGEYPAVGPNGQLVFRGWGNTGTGIRLSSPDLEDIVEVTIRDDDTAPALSPDGKKIAFMSRRDGNWGIYLVNADGSGLKRLTDDLADDGLPTWSPDGRAIAFLSSRDETWGVWAMTPDGDDQRLLFEIEGSPNGLVGANRDASRGWTEERMSWTK